jgi:hypothetical protein
MSTQPRRKPAPQKRQSAKVPDLWKPAPPLPEAEPIEMPTEVGSLLKSLGDPPTHNGAAAARFCDTITQRAAGVAMALAISVDLWAESHESTTR